MTKEISSDEMFTFILDTPFFDKLDPRELMDIFHVIESFQYKAGEEIFHEGDPGDAWYIVYEGGVEVVRHGKTLAVLGEKECFGEMSVLDKLPRSATVKAITDSTLMKISGDSFDKLLEEKHMAAYKLIQQMAITLSGRQRRATARLSALMKVDDLDHVQVGIRDVISKTSPGE